MRSPVRSSGRLLAQVVVAAACLLGAGDAAILAAGPERVPVLAQVLYLPYLLFLAPAVVAALAALALRWPWRVAAAANLLLVLGYAMDFTWGEPEGGEYRVRVMTFNVKDYETLEQPGGGPEIAREIERFAPDVVVLQDAYEILDLAAVGEILKGMAAFSHGEYVIATRYRLEHCEGLQGGERPGRLEHLRCVVRSPDWSLDVHAVHLLSPRRGLDALRKVDPAGLDTWADNVVARMRQARALADYLARAPRPMVVAGDLNAPAHSLALRELEGAGLRDAFAAAGRGFGFTYGHRLRPGLSFLRLDHVLVDSSIGVAACAVAPPGISPHRAVIADLVLRPSR